MENEKLLNMEPHMLLSWINTKLRDEFKSLEKLCEEYGFKCEIVEAKLKTIGYGYNNDVNQFKVFCN
jgi:hypothetical protein